MPGPRVVVLGASPNPERTSHEAVARLAARGFDVVPVHPSATDVLGLPVAKDLATVAHPVDTVTVYVSPAHSAPLADALLALAPRQAIFNPGAENPDLRARLEAAGIVCRDACTLVLLATGRF